MAHDKVKIKMLTTSAGPKESFKMGSIRVVSDKEAKELISGGYAKLIEEKKPKSKEVEKVEKKPKSKEK